MKAHEKLLNVLLGVPLPEGDVGIEIEVEGRNLPPSEGLPARWERHEDGSLRDGAEYVFKRPLAITKVNEALMQLNNSFKANASDLSFSFRTSVHVHVNCLDLNHVQICNFIYTYLLLEPVLVNYAGESRKGNRFCLRLEDADGGLELLECLFQEWQEGVASLRMNIVRNQNRYAAMNVESLITHGTLEFRSMRGTNDENIITPWAEVLFNIKKVSSTFQSPHEIYEALHKMGVQEFAKLVFGVHALKFLYPGYEDDVNRYASYTIDLPFYFRNFEEENKKKEDIPVRKAKAVKKPVEAQPAGGVWGANPFVQELDFPPLARGYIPLPDHARNMNEDRLQEINEHRRDQGMAQYVRVPQ